jgi:hypothetical protein
LDTLSRLDRKAVEELSPYLEQLCYSHLQRYAKLTAIFADPSSEIILHTDAKPLVRQRRASLSDIPGPQSKKPRLDPPIPFSPTKTSIPGTDRCTI